jgi:hypothetical protein
MSWSGPCDDCRSVATTWAIFLIIALAGTATVRWRRWTLAPVFLIWVIAVRDQLGYLSAGTDRGLVWHAFAAIATGLAAPLLMALVTRKHTRRSSSASAA